MVRLLLFIAFTVCSFSLFAASGDTSHVVVHNKTLMGGYGSYSNWAVFPTAGKQYRKVIMIYKLQCPSTGCTDYDYTQKIFISRRGGLRADTPKVEITRLINPFGRDISKSGPGLTYRSDVTDYISLLKDSVEVTCSFEGYPINGEGWLLTLDFEFIEGIPPQEAYRVQNMWNGYFAYGSLENGVDIIEKNLTEKQVTIDSNASGTLLRVTPTGHGFGGSQNCAEFCRKKYSLKLDGTIIAEKEIWREDCGENPVYPGFGAQANGTWPYDRANWCPGALVSRYDHNLSTLVKPKENHSLNIDMQTGIGGGSAGYHFECQLINYKPISHVLDVSLEEITSPSMAQDYNRLNPVCGDVKVIIRNTGSTDLTMLNINFGPNQAH